MPARSLIIYNEFSYGKRESSDCNVYHAAPMGWRDICHQRMMNNLFTEIDYFHIGFRQTHIECMGKERTSENKVVLTKIDSAQLTYILPSPHYEGVISVEEALSHRRSHRSYIKDSIPAEDLSQILWAAYGITKPLTGYPQTGEV